MLIIHPALAPYRLDLLNVLAQRCELQLVFLRNNLLSQKFDQAVLVKQLKANHVYLNQGFTILTRTFRFGISREISRFHPNIVITQEFSPATLSVILFSLLRNKTFRHILWTDDNPESIHIDTKVRRMLRQLVLPNVDGLVCLSEEAAALYRTKYGAMVPIGISPIIHKETVFRDALLRATPIALKLIEEYRLEDKRILLFVGRLAQEKRIDRLFLAFSRLHDAFIDACLVLVGHGPQREPLQKLAQALGIADRVIFVGRAEGASLYAWYRFGGMFVLASEFERFGAVVNEALLAGMPVICTDKAGAHVLIHEGVNGSVVDAADSTSLQSAMHDWLTRTPPLTVSSLDRLRPSLMTTTFQDAVEGFLSVINAANGAAYCRSGSQT